MKVFFQLQLVDAKVPEISVSDMFPSATHVDN